VLAVAVAVAVASATTTTTMVHRQKENNPISKESKTEKTKMMKQNAKEEEATPPEIRRVARRWRGGTRRGECTMAMLLLWGEVPVATVYCDAVVVVVVVVGGEEAC